MRRVVFTENVGKVAGQREQVLTVATRGPAFALNETLFPDGRSYPSNLELLGATCLTARTAWSKDHQQLVVTYQIKTNTEKKAN
jgi:hypothetical protein